MSKPAPPTPTPAPKMEAEPVIIGPDGSRTDAAIHEPILNNPAARSRFAADAVHRAVTGGATLAEAMQLYGHDLRPGDEPAE